MGNFEKVVRTRYKHPGFITKLYNAMICYREVDNGLDLLKNVHCFKILSFDDQDDVIDSFSSLHHSLAVKLSKHSYREKEWHEFYKQLVFIFELEHELMQRQEIKWNPNNISTSNSRTDNTKSSNMKDISSGKSVYPDIIKSVSMAEN